MAGSAAVSRLKASKSKLISTNASSATAAGVVALTESALGASKSKLTSAMAVSAKAVISVGAVSKLKASKSKLTSDATATVSTAAGASLLAGT